MKLKLFTSALLMVFSSCGTSHSSSLRATPGQSLQANVFKNKFHNVFLAQNGDLFCNGTSSQRQGRKIATDIKWFDLDGFDGVWVLDKNDIVTQISINNYCDFVSSTRRESSAMKAVTVKDARTGAIVLSSDRNVHTYGTPGVKSFVASNIVDIAEGCFKKFGLHLSEYIGFALEGNGIVYGLSDFGAKKIVASGYDSLQKFLKHEGACKL